MTSGSPSSLGAIALICGLYVAAAGFLGGGYYQNLLTMIPIFAVLGLSWNLLGGYAGVISFGHAAFFGIGAFTTTLLLLRANVSPWLGIPVGMALGAIAGLLIGLPTLRLRGVHFALAMLAYPTVLRFVLDWLRYQEVMLPRKAADGWAYMQFDDVRGYAVVATAILFVALVVCHFVEKSRFGLALTAIRQDEQAAEAAGINIWRTKMIAIAISGAMAGAAGGLYVVLIRVAVPADVFGLHISAQAMVVTLFGGIGTLWGPVIGAALLIPLGEALYSVLGHSVPGIHSIVYGIALIIVVLVAPEGLFWSARDRLKARKARSGVGSAPIARPVEASNVVPMPARPLRAEPTAVAKGQDLLVVEGLSKSFRGLKAVSQVGFSVPAGSIFGVIGQNGAGKTTMFNLLNGFVRPDAGRVTFEGHELVGLRPDQISRLGVGRTFQVVRPFLRLSLLQNVVAGAIATAPDAAAALERAHAALVTVGLADRADTPAGGLNGLELRLLELARALASQPKLVLLDEIFAGLATTEVEQLLEVIRRLPGHGVTVMIIEHTMHAMLRLCDTLLVLDHGEVIASARPQEVVNAPQVVEAYLGRKWVSHHAAG
jgi:ABC-type branched-subunit amino acid transport system ATPase component/ABC-type branched-subunit amino acid transport system permease subunit